MKTALFVDFDDSFSFNVIQELEEVGLEVQVVNWSDVKELPNLDVLVIGPGPGRPDDYGVVLPLIKSWIDAGRPYFGVCLGHQIFFHLHGFAIQRSPNPVHGQRVSLKIGSYWQKLLKLPSLIQVQRYNSLSVMNEGKFQSGFEVHEENGEVLMCHGKNVLTYQFHPESVGTSFRRSFFMPLTKDIL